MAFEKGKSGNPAGKPVGTKSKPTTELRATLTKFLEENFEKIKDDFTSLPAKERARLYCDLLQYGIPKLQAMTMQTEFDTLTTEQLDQIIEQLKNSGTYD